jgi:hypothetical protein
LPPRPSWRVGKAFFDIHNRDLQLVHPRLDAILEILPHDEICVGLSTRPLFSKGRPVNPLGFDAQRTKEDRGIKYETSNELKKSQMCLGMGRLLFLSLLTLLKCKFPRLQLDKF